MQEGLWCCTLVLHVGSELDMMCDAKWFIMVYYGLSLEHGPKTSFS